MNHTIVIADDDDDVVEEMQANLSLDGYTIHVAANGQDALDLAREIQPDLVILDIVMPILDGFQTCKAIRENPQTSAVSVILLTSQAIGQDKIRGLQLGADDYIVKPIDWEEFRARVAGVLRRAAQLRDLSPLTNLPGNFRISSELAVLVADQKNKYALLNVEINDFKSINDRYGSGRGDKVIKFLGTTLADIMSGKKEEPSVLGHIGGSRFVIIAAPQNVEAICADIIDRFDKGIVEFYDDDARAQGYIETTNRQNEQVKHPICTVAIGVVSTEWREVRSQWEATATAAEMCEHAKRQGVSSFEIDRRRTDDQFLAMLES
jgi:diguanylate cyclase (GGDEF)-like protein